MAPVSAPYDDAVTSAYKAISRNVTKQHGYPMPGEFRTEFLSTYHKCQQHVLSPFPLYTSCFHSLFLETVPALFTSKLLPL